ncbi:tetratricopeptide repeat protein [uncultured Croceitalea sp.]|uniref:tetratricopeptide repeat protein n=1 Tax=uncultured Croceitalea sp. TaxID=1798908 RepID=UPI00374E678F
MFYTYLFLLLVFVVFLRPVSTLIHELGHGLPALLLTDGKVTLYLGSYGNPDDSIKINLGRLEIYFRKNPFHWKVGLCKMHSESVSINRQIFVTLMGPIMSLALALIVTYYVFFTDLNGDFIVLLFFFGISTYFDFFANIIPQRQPIKLHDGTVTHNDGQIILNLLKFKKLPSEYEEGITLYNKKEFAKAAELFKKVLESGHKEDFVYRLTISSFLSVLDYKKAKVLNDEFEKKFKAKNFASNDYNTSGFLKSYFKDFNEGLEDYKTSLELNPNNSYSLNNRGYTYNLIGEYEKAILDFNKAIELEPEHAYAYNNRGLSKIKLGKAEDGLKDIEQSMRLDENNSYAHMNLGIYYYDLGDFTKALEKFNLALKLDKNTYEIQERISETKSKLNL